MKCLPILACLVGYSVAESLRGRILESEFFHPEGVRPIVKKLDPITPKGAKTKSPTEPKGSKWKGAPSAPAATPSMPAHSPILPPTPPGKGPKGSTLKSSSPSSPNGKSPTTKGVKGGSSPKGGPKGSKGSDESSSSESAEYDERVVQAEEFDNAKYKDATAKNIPVSAFLYNTRSSLHPSMEEYDELSKVTKILFEEMFNFSYFESESQFVGIFMPQYILLGPRLVDFDLSPYFHTKRVLPSLFEVETIPREGLEQDQEFYNLLMERLRSMKSPVFSSTTSFQYISTNSELDAAKAKQAQNGSTWKQLVIIVVPCVIGGLLLLLFGTWYLRKNRRRHRTIIMEELNAIEVKHQSESGSVAGDNVTQATYLWGSRDRTDSESDDYSDPPELDKLMLETDDILSGLEEISLADEEKLDLKQRMAEIRRNYERRSSDPPAEAKNVAEVPNRSMYIANAAVGKSTIQTKKDPEPAKPDRFEINKQAIVNKHVGEVDRTLYRSAKTPSSKAQIKQWPTPTTTVPKDQPRHGQVSELESSDSDSDDDQMPSWKKAILARQAAAKNDPTRPSIRISPTRKPAKFSVAPSSARIDDDESVFTIDSQSSSTPEFLKKFKQMGLHKASKAPVVVTSPPAAKPSPPAQYASTPHGKQSAPVPTSASTKYTSKVKALVPTLAPTTNEDETMSLMSSEDAALLTPSTEEATNGQVVTPKPKMLDEMTGKSESFEDTADQIVSFEEAADKVESFEEAADHTESLETEPMKERSLEGHADDVDTFDIDEEEQVQPLQGVKVYNQAASRLSVNADDEASVFTIDSQSSTTPEFMKKFKSMGFKRYK